MVKRSVVVLPLVLMVVFVGCGEDDLGGVAKVTGTYLLLVSKSILMVS